MGFYLWATGGLGVFVVFNFPSANASEYFLVGVLMTKKVFSVSKYCKQDKVYLKMLNFLLHFHSDKAVNLTR